MIYKNKENVEKIQFFVEILPEKLLKFCLSPRLSQKPHDGTYQTIYVLKTIDSPLSKYHNFILFHRAVFDRDYILPLFAQL